MVLFYRVVGSLAGLSMFGSFLILLTAFLSRRLRQHPYSLVVAIAVCDFLFSLKYVVIALYPNSSTLNENEAWCKTTGLWTNFFALASVSWSAVMSVNLILNTAKPFGDTQSMGKWYHLFVWSISAASTLVVGLGDDIGISADGTCWFAEQKSFHWQFYVPLGIYFVLAVGATLFAVFRTWNFASGAKRYATTLVVRMLLYVSVFILSWLGPTVNEIYTSLHEPVVSPAIDPAIPVNDAPEAFNPEGKLTWWTGVSVALIGFLNALIWLSNPTIYALIKTRMLRRWCGFCFERAERLALLGKIEAIILEDQDADIHNLNIVFRNNAIACLLLGIRYSLYELSAASRFDPQRTAHTALNDPDYQDIPRATEPSPVPGSQKLNGGPPKPTASPALAIPSVSSSASSHGMSQSLMSSHYGSLDESNDAYIPMKSQVSASVPNESVARLSQGWSVPQRKPFVHAVPAGKYAEAGLRSADDVHLKLTGPPTTTDDDLPPVNWKDGPEDVFEDGFVPDDVPHILARPDFDYVEHRDLSPENLEQLNVDDLFTSPFSFGDVAPHVFHNIRIRFGFKSADYYRALNPGPFLNAVLENQERSAGRSGSFMVFSPDRRFLLKTIPDHEAKTMIRILPAYYNHVESNPRTLLSPILGLYSLALAGAPQLHIIVMANLFSHELLTPNLVYDLKGSWVDRGGRTTKGVRKDNDLRQQLQLDSAEARDLFVQLDADSKLLSSQGVMDYSLLVGVHDLAKSQSIDAYLPPRRRIPRKSVHRPSMDLDASASVGSTTDGTLAVTPNGSINSYDPTFHGSVPTIEPSNMTLASPPVQTLLSEPPLGLTINIPTVSTSNWGSAPNTMDSDASEDIRMRHTHPERYSALVGKKDRRVLSTCARVLDSTDHEQVFIFGIIDILQSYSLQKRMERFIKVYFRCKSKTGLSAIDPDSYQARFRTAMAGHIGVMTGDDL